MPLWFKHKCQRLPVPASQTWEFDGFLWGFDLLVRQNQTFKDSVTVWTKQKHQLCEPHSLCYRQTDNEIIITCIPIKHIRLCITDKLHTGLGSCPGGSVVSILELLPLSVCLVLPSPLRSHPQISGIAQGIAALILIMPFYFVGSIIFVNPFNQSSSDTNTGLENSQVET